MLESEEVSLLDLNGLYSIENDEVSFYSKKKITVCKLNSIYKLIDPVYDQVFKSIFKFGNISNGVDGKQRLISFLNSLISQKYKDKIINIEYMSNEFTKPNEKRKNSTIITDIVLKANFKNNKILYIDIEMQISFHQKIYKRWVQYASRLYSDFQQETLILIFQVSDKKNLWYSIEPKKKDVIPYNPFYIESKIDDTYEILSIDVGTAISLIKENKEIQIGDDNISQEGKNWLKLIGMRFWMNQYENYFILPQNIKVSKEILSAVVLLSKYKPEEIISILNLNKIKQISFEDGYYTCKEKMKEEYDIKLLMYLFKNKLNTPFNEADCVNEKKVRELYKDENCLEQFIEFLDKSGKLKKSQ